MKRLTFSIGRWIRCGFEVGPSESLRSLSGPKQVRVHETRNESSQQTGLVPGPRTVNFWDALDPAERGALKSVASSRAFAVGQRLLCEGEPADHVILIIEGRTRICVDENGWERVLGERGPGQLVGERGGLNVHVRVCSATLIAIEPVWALVVPTEDFTAFVRAHPRVLDIVESQLYQWLIEDQAPYRGATVKDGRPPPLSGENCTILLTDVVAFGSPSRNDEDRRVIREALFGMTNMTLRSMTDVRSEDRGDGLLTVVPPSIPTANVIERLVTELPRSLERHNSANRESAQIRLRVAVDVGPVITDTLGVSGQAIIVAARLVEAPTFKEAIAQSSANLGLIVSPFVYDTAVRHTLNPIDLAGYSPIQVRVKGFSSSAWVKLFDVPTWPSYFFQPVTTARLGALSTSDLWRRQGTVTVRAGALAGPGFPGG